jgi:hypothetical protein
MGSVKKTVEKREGGKFTKEIKERKKMVMENGMKKIISR